MMIGKLAFTATLLAACSDPTVQPDAAVIDATIIDAVNDASPIPEAGREIDILFVIDDSVTMADKQAKLRENFPNFINVLETIQGGLPNVHIGVVSPDLGTSAAADAQPGPTVGSGAGSCAGQGKAGNLVTNGTPLVMGNYIIDIKNTDGSRTKNYTGPLAAAFSAIANVGTSGCGFEQPLEAAKRALAPNHPMNQGFLRPQAYLALIFITDEDDCSLAHTSLLGPDTVTLGPLASFRCNRFGHTCDVGGATPDAMNQVGTKSQCHSNESSAYLTRVADYVAYFKGLKTDPLKVIVAGVMGTTEPYQVELRAPPGGGTAAQAVAASCSYFGASGIQVADPGTRLQVFLDQFPNRSTFTTICQQNLSDGLVLIAQLLTGP